MEEQVSSEVRRGRPTEGIAAERMEAAVSKVKMGQDRRGYCCTARMETRRNRSVVERQSWNGTGKREADGGHNCIGVGGKSKGRDGLWRVRREVL